MLTKKDLTAMQKIFREELSLLREDLKSLSIRADVKEIKQVTYEFHEDVLDVMALMKMQHKIIIDLDKRLEKLEKILYSYTS